MTNFGKGLEMGYDCQTCGKRMPPGPEFHPFAACIEYKLEHGLDLTDDMKRYVWEAGLALVHREAAGTEPVNA